MVSSACDVLLAEPERFINYILVDKKLREKIIDKKSFINVLEKVLNEDTILSNIVKEIKRRGESLEICAENIYNLKEIQTLIKENLKNKETEIKKRIKKEKPNITKSELLKEVNRRMSIYISTSKTNIKKIKQVTLTDALKPIKVKGYFRKGKKVSGYRKTKNKSLTTQERMLLENAIKKGKKPREVIKEYLQAGIGYRTKISLRKHYYRLLRDMKRKK